MKFGAYLSQKGWKIFLINPFCSLTTWFLKNETLLMFPQSLLDFCHNMNLHFMHIFLFRFSLSFFVVWIFVLIFISEECKLSLYACLMYHIFNTLISLWILLIFLPLWKFFSRWNLADIHTLVQGWRKLFGAGVNRTKEAFCHVLLL